SGISSCNRPISLAPKSSTMKLIPVTFASGRRQRIEGQLWAIHEADIANFFETVEVAKSDKGSRAATAETGKMLTVKKQRPRLLSDLPLDLRKAIEHVQIGLAATWCRTFIPSCRQMLNCVRCSTSGAQPPALKKQKQRRANPDNACRPLRLTCANISARNRSRQKEVCVREAHYYGIVTLQSGARAPNSRGFTDRRRVRIVLRVCVRRGRQYTLTGRAVFQTARGFPKERSRSQQIHPGERRCH